jgi:PhnB protein
VTKLHSYLNFAGNAQEAFDFYKSVFGGEFSSLVRFKDFPMEGVAISEDDEDKIRVARAAVGARQQRLRVAA